MKRLDGRVGSALLAGRIDLAMSRYLLVLVRLIAAWILGFMASVAAADGKVFGEPLTTVTIPDQSALVVWDGREQQLAIETRAVGEGTRFAWVVPLPARPTSVEPLSSGIFPTLRAMTRPAVKTSHMLGPLAFVAVFVVLPIAAVAWSGRPASSIGRVLMASFLCTCVLGGLLMPSMGKARGSPGGPDDAGVEVLDRRLVGSYEVEVITAADPAAMSAWLAERGLASTPAADRVIAEYVREGWVFVASRLQREASSAEPMTPHPLLFRFPATQMVYPVRLTATDGRPLGLELYVAGAGLEEQGVRAAGLSVERCGRLLRGVSTSVDQRPSPVMADQIPLGHSRLGPLLDGAVTLTKLSGELSPQQMSRDVQIELTGEPYDAVVETKWTPEAARSFAVFVAVIVGVAVVVVAAVLARLRQSGVALGSRSIHDAAKPRSSLPLLGAVAISSLAVWSVATLVLHHRLAEVVADRRGWRLSLSGWQSAVWDAASSAGPLVFASDEAWVAMVDRVVTKRDGLSKWSALGLTRGDAPGQYRAELTRDGVGLVRLVDMTGVERVIEVPASAFVEQPARP